MSTNERLINPSSSNHAPYFPTERTLRFNQPYYDSQGHYKVACLYLRKLHKHIMYSVHVKGYLDLLFTFLVHQHVLWYEADGEFKSLVWKRSFGHYVLSSK